MNDAIISDIYEKNNFPGVNVLTKLVKKDHPAIKSSYIKKWYDNQLEIQLLHKQQKQDDSGHITAFQENEMWNIDIFDLSQHWEHNRGQKYIFAAEDVFTRKAYAEPMTAKDGDNVAGALFSIIMEHKAKPRVLLADSDAAYTSAAFKEVMDQNDIAMDNVTVGDHNAMGIIDNFARRLKFIFTKNRVKNDYSQRWVHRLQEVIKQYNQTAHSGIASLSPNKAGEEESKELVVKLNREKSTYNHTVSDLKAGDRVRVLEANIFTKGTEPKWSKEVYDVVLAKGQTITINEDGNEKRYKRHKLLMVPNN